jgi:hypothetical protein
MYLFIHPCIYLFIYPFIHFFTYYSSSSKVCPLYSGFPSPKTTFRHLSLSLVSSSVSPWFVMLRLTPFIQLSLGLPLLRVPTGSHSKIFSGTYYLLIYLYAFSIVVIMKAPGEQPPTPRGK